MLKADEAHDSYGKALVFGWPGLSAHDYSPGLGGGSRDTGLIGGTFGRPFEPLPAVCIPNVHQY